MKITELIDLLKYHLSQFGDLEVKGFIGTAIVDGKLEIESESTTYKKQMSENIQDFLSRHKDQILKLYDSN